MVILSLSWAVALPQYNLVEYKLLQRNPAGVAACYSTAFGLKQKEKKGRLALMSDTVRSELLFPASESFSQLLREVLSPKMQDLYPPGLVEKRL